jgi:site-specific DNA-cytosine methylase
MRVLIACEESQTVCKAFRELGHEAYSCDILPCSGGHPEWHIKCDVLKIINGGNFPLADGESTIWIDNWDLIIAHPPCTDLSVSGARYFKEKQADGRQQRSIDFFMKFVNAKCKKIAIENPVGIMSTKYRKPDQIINPREFGHTTNKKTCLWLKNLPKLKPTKIIPFDKRTNDIHLMPPSKERAKLKSKTFLGIAKAMAQQWSE